MPVTPGYISNPQGAFGLGDALNVQGEAVNGLFAPAGALTLFKNRLRTTSQPRISIVGDSIPWGGYASHVGATGLGTDCISVLRRGLQQQFGNGGCGFRSSYDCVASTLVANYGFLAAELGSNTGGPWNIYNAGGSTDGPGSLQLVNGPASGAGPFVAGTLTWRNVYGSTINLYSADTNATVNISIDGGANIPIVLTNTSSIRKNLVASNLPPGPHTVVLSVGAVGVFICGIEGLNPTGAVVHNYSQIGYTSQSVANAAVWTNGFAPSWMGGVNNPADLVIYQMGVNDAGSAVQPFLVSNTANGVIGAFNSYLDWVRVFLDGIRDTTNNTPPDVLLWHSHIGNTEAAGPKKRAWSQYAMGFLGLAQVYNCAYINFWTLGRNSYSNWTNLSYWGSAANPGLPGADGVHLSDIGHNYVGSTFLQLLTQ